MNRINKDNGVRIFPGIHQRYPITTLFTNCNMNESFFLYILSNTKSYCIIAPICITNTDYKNRMFILHYLHLFYFFFALFASTIFMRVGFCGELFLLFLYPIYLEFQKMSGA